MATRVTVNRMLGLNAASSAQACSPSPEVRGCTIVMCGRKLIVLPGETAAVRNARSPPSRSWIPRKTPPDGDPS
jgi:hypothetical protein